MGKLGLAGTSLAAAIPGGILSYLLLMAVLKSLEPMPMVMKVATLATLVISLLMALFPAYVLIWYRRGGSAAAASRNAGAAGIAAQSEDDADIYAEDLIGEEFLDEMETEPDEEWDAESDLESGDMMTGEFQAIDDETAVHPDSDLLEEDAYPTSAFEVDEDLADGTEPVDEFGKTVEDMGQLDLDLDEEFESVAEFDAPDLQGIDEGPQDDDFQQTLELPVEDDADEVDLFGQTLEEFDPIQPDDDFTPAGDLDDEFTFDDFEDEDDETKK